MGDEEIKEQLKKILGEDAFSDGRMQVTDRVQKLVKSVSYLTTQIKLTGNLEDNKERKEHVKQVIERLKKMID